MDDFDVAVIGAGFGGLGAALSLAERGARVVLLEALAYGGGCASTFTRGGARYEAGATLFSGFGTGQLFARWIEAHALDVQFMPLDPLVELRTGSFSLAIPPDRDALVARLASLPDVPERVLRNFFEEQTVVANALWSLFSDPSLLPPLDVGALARHALRVPAYAPLLRHVGQPLERALVRHGLADCAPLRSYLDAVCQITVQTSAREAESPFAMAAMDYFFRGTGHVRGGIGELAAALLGAVRARGGDVRLATRVDTLERDGRGWRLETRRGPVRARHAVANLLPDDAARLANVELRGAPARIAAEVERGWGAVMLYRVLRSDAVDEPAPHHLELVRDASAPFVDGNHVFVSISGADEGRVERRGGLDGTERTLTCSTHVSLEALRSLDETSRAARVQEIQQRMRATIAARAPEIDRATVRELTASPRTFERFTRRPEGRVGGIPRRAGLGHYRQLGPLELARGLWLVGDSVFPGQSTLATALGGVRVAEAIMRRA